MLHYTAFPTYLKSVRHFYFDTHVWKLHKNYCKLTHKF